MRTHSKNGFNCTSSKTNVRVSKKLIDPCLQKILDSRLNMKNFTKAKIHFQNGNFKSKMLITPTKYCEMFFSVFFSEIDTYIILKTDG